MVHLTFNILESRRKHVVSLSQEFRSHETEQDILIPFLIEFKVWVLQNPSTSLKIPQFPKEFAKISTTDLRSCLHKWDDYIMFAKNVLNRTPINQNTKLAMGALDVTPDLIRAFKSGDILPDLPINFIDAGESYIFLIIVPDFDSNIPNFIGDDPVGAFPFSYASMLKFMADLIGIRPRLLEKGVHREEVLLFKPINKFFE